MGETETSFLMAQLDSPQWLDLRQGRTIKIDGRLWRFGSTSDGCYVLQQRLPGGEWQQVAAQRWEFFR